MSGVRFREHLLVESQGPWTGPGCARFVSDATALARAGGSTRLVLVQDGVLAAVPNALAAVDGLLDAGGELWVDDFSWRQRALAGVVVRSGGRLAGMDEVAERVLDPAVQVVWH